MLRLSVILTASAVSLFALPAMAVPTLYFGNNQAPVPSLAGTSASKTAQTNWLSSFTSSLRQDQDNDAIGFDTVIVAAPEPSSLAVLGFAAAAMVGSLRLTKKRARTAAPLPA